MLKIVYKFRKNKINKIFKIVLKNTNKHKKILDTLGNYNTHYSYKSIILNKKSFMKWIIHFGASPKKKLIKKLNNFFFFKDLNL